MDTLQALRNADIEWCIALANNDIELISFYMAADWVIIGKDGMTSKEAFLDVIGSGELVHTQMDAEERRIKVYGDTGIVSGKGTSSGTFRGSTFSFYEWSTSVYTLMDNKWKCVLTMLTETEKAA